MPLKEALPSKLFLIALLSCSLLAGCGGGSSGSDDNSANNDDTGQVSGNGSGSADDDDSDGEDGGNGGGDTTVQSALAMAAPLSPVIRSGFGAGVVGAPQFPNSWDRLLASSDERVGGYFEIQYQGGDTTQRYARLVPDPADADNQVLEFWLQDANVRLEDPNSDWFELRGRVQANFYENYNLDSYYQSVRLKLGPDFASMMAHAGTFNWLTLFEAWNGANWIAGEQFPFHIAVDLTKPDGASGARLHLQAQGRTYVPGVGFEPIWADTNRDFAVPLEQWMTLELYMRQGDDQDGRFYMTVAVDGAEPMVLFDVADYTHHPDDPAPGGFDYVNPMKLYTLGPVLDIVSETGGAMALYWDDLEFGHTAN